jgi:hypothetical protein
MTVGRLLLALLGHVLRGRAGQRVYVIVDGHLPDHAQDEVDARDWAISRTGAPRLGRNRFVVVVAQPRPADVADGSWGTW